MSATIHQLPEAGRGLPAIPIANGTTPRAPCRHCWGRGYVGQYIHNWRLGTSEWTGDSQCSFCDGPGTHRGRTDEETAAQATVDFQRDYAAAGDALTVEQNRMLADAARYDAGELDAESTPAYWRDEAARCATNLRFIDRSLARHYRRAAATGQEPDPEALRPGLEEREVWVEWMQHCLYMGHVLDKEAA